MSLWLVVPRDPLIFRDGKPFSAIPGERSKSMLFPYPATLAGAVRTRTGTDLASDKFDSSRVKELKEIAVRGPVLVELDRSGHLIDWFFPAPADALLVVKNDKHERHSLAPLELPQGVLSNLNGMKLVGPSINIKDKPLSHPPHYWNWEHLKAWLENPIDGQIVIKELGIQGPEREMRTHVSIVSGIQTALPGALFQTSGMEFIELDREKEETPKLNDARTLALVLDTKTNLVEGVDFLGGERRAVCWEKVDPKVALPVCPETVRKDIIEKGSCRLILATPAYFEKDYLPTKLECFNNLTVTIQAVALPRYQTISGWDYDIKKPKSTRRLAPAGTVYFLNLEGDKIAMEHFIETTWMNPISDDGQFTNDGFGLALLGTWDGKMRKMEVRS